MIVVEPSSGLCSRIYSLSDAYNLAQKTNQELVIIWGRTSDCNCRYSDIFSEFQFKDIKLKVIEVYFFGRHLKQLNRKRLGELGLGVLEILLRGMNLIKYWSYKIYYIKRCKLYINSYKDKNDFFDEELAKQNSCYFEIFCGFNRKHELRSIKFHDVFIKRSKEILACIDKKNCVGVHVRRTDHAIAKELSTTDKFVNIMKKLVAQNSEIKFYLATDDWNEEKLFTNIFGEKIITQEEKVLNRDSLDGMRASVIDFLCLSQTERILGSCTSVFSKFAAELGGVELTIV